MNSPSINVRIEATAVVGGILITLLLLLLMTWSHQFLTRRSAERATYNIHAVALQSNGPAASQSNMSSVPDDLHTVMQSISAQNQVVPKLILQDAPTLLQDISSPVQLLHSSMDENFQPESLSQISGDIGGMPESAPQALFVPKALFPENLIREGIVQGDAILLIRIDAMGRCQVLRVLRCSHPELEEVIARAAGKSLFQIPLKDGKVQPRDFLWPVTFKANEDRIRLIQHGGDQ